MSRDWPMIILLGGSGQHKNPTCGIPLGPKCRRGSTAGKTTRCIPAEETGQPHVSAILTEDGDQRLNPATARNGGTERDPENVGTPF